MKIFVFTLLLSLNGVFAQGPAMPPPQLDVFWNLGQDTLVIQMSLPSPWHITANESPDTFVSPAKLEIEEPIQGWGKPLWPEPLKRPVPELETVAWEFKGTFQIKVPFVGGVTPSAESVRLFVEYQACSNQICLAPQKIYWGKRLRSF